MSSARFVRVFFLQLVWLVALCGSAISALAADGPAPAAEPVASETIHNMFRVTPRIYSGSQPETDAAFAELAGFGVTTIVSVDGAKPDLAAAHRHGLKYVHLPFGYGGIPTNRVAELASVLKTVSGPVFVHCHHGKHRGPAAVAVICLADEGWTPQRADAWLRQAGTAVDYAGLYRAVSEFQPPNAAALAAVAKNNLPEVARTSSLVEAMVAIDEHFDRLKQVQQAGWKVPPDHPDRVPSHEATLLWEQLRELVRHEDTVRRPDEFKSGLAASEQAADALRQTLKRATDGERDAALKKLTQTCAACHKQYRN